MAIRFIDKKTAFFHFTDDNNKDRTFKLIFGDEVKTLAGSAPSGAKWRRIRYRGRTGEMEAPKLTKQRPLEMYFLDVGQGDAAFIVTPDNQKILVDGGLKSRALGFLIWKYRLNEPNTSVTIDKLILSHADKDHVEGLIPILDHDKIVVNEILHNGIGVFKSGFNTKLGKKNGGILKTSHSSISDLNGLDLSDDFEKWISAVRRENSLYRAVEAEKDDFAIGDPEITIEFVGPIREADGQSFKWFNSKAHTINGHSVAFRLTYNKVRTFFSGDLNIKGSKHLLSQANAALRIDSHVFKTPHHGSHEFHQPLLDAIRPIVSVISSGDSPDHGHPRASFMGGVGRAGRGTEPLIFSTEIAATFSDLGDDHAVEEDPGDPNNIGDLDFALSESNTIARRRFKKVLPGIINVRSDGERIYAARRVMAGYQWEAYDPILVD